MKLKQLISLIVLLGLQLNLCAQDPSFSQFYASRMYLNPAFTGMESGVSVAGVSRMQWISVDRGFRTYGATVEIQEPYIRSGIGLSIFHSEEGLAQLNTSSIGLSYAYTIPLRNSNLHIGMQAQWVQKSVNWDNITFSDELDPVHGKVYTSTATPVLDRVSFSDFNLGIVYRFNSKLRLKRKTIKNIRTSIGVSLNHAPYLFNKNGGNESLQNLNTSTTPRLTIHGGTMIPLVFIGSTKKKIAISPNFKFDVQGDDLLQLKENLQVFTYGLYLFYEGAYVGAFYQNKQALSNLKNTNSLILAVGAYVKASKSKNKRKFFIGLSYDANTTGLGTRAGGVYEFAFRWNFNTKKHLFGGGRGSSSKNVLDCNNFF